LSKVLVLGAGISGLAAAHWMEKEGYQVHILEKGTEPGGAMLTRHKDGFLVDYGPNSGLETTPLISKIAKDVGIYEDMIYANEEGDTRYILRDNKLRALPTGGKAFLKADLFSTKGKMRLALEPFIGRSEDGYYQSISEFVSRRLGKEFLDYAINPFVSGVYAGDPDKLSVKSAFPKLYALEENYGGLIKGMIKGAKERKKRDEESKQSAKMFSFVNGMQTLPKAIANNLNATIEFNSEVDQITKEDDKWKVKYKSSGFEKEIHTDVVYSTIPAYTISDILKDIDPKVSEHLDDIYYPPVMVLYLGYDKKQIGQQLDGFGYLIPSKEKKTFLGAIWSSTIFKHRAEEDKASFTLFIGGARAPHLFEHNHDELIQTVINEFQDIMQITGEPVFKENKFWKKAIPQYNIGYIEHERYFDEFEKNNPGLFLGGNYRGGISVGDCMKNSWTNFEKVKNYIENK
jgi:oxygen-dependent protoporphyrinogen oxidase